MKCPKCGSAETYRKTKYDLVVNCDRCRHSWKTNQVASPIAQFKLHKTRGLMKGSHYVNVWLCPRDQSKYSFSLVYGAVASFPEPDYPEVPYLKGKFDTPQEAIDAGIKEIYED